MICFQGGTKTRKPQSVPSPPAGRKTPPKPAPRQQPQPVPQRPQQPQPQPQPQEDEEGSAG